MNWIEAIQTERQRQFELPGTEADYLKSPDNWIATIMSILGEGVERSNVPPSRVDFERSIVKAAAVCIAALDHIEHMTEKKTLG
jgi:hypothetical protein